MSKVLTFTGTRFRDGAEVRLMARDSGEQDPYTGRGLYGLTLSCKPQGGKRYTVARVSGFRPGVWLAGTPDTFGDCAVSLLWHSVTHTEDDREREDVGEVRAGVARFLFEIGMVQPSGRVPYMGDAMGEGVRWDFDEEVEG
jgi:hypothetical protein